MTNRSQARSLARQTWRRGGGAVCAFASRAAESPLWVVAGAVSTVFLVALGPALLGASSLVEADLLRIYAPWRDVTHHIPTEGLTPAHDTLDFYLPFRVEAARRIAEGDIPLWEPYSGGGTPLAAVPNIGFWSPFNFPYLVMPIWLAPSYVRLLVVLVAIGTSYALLRSLNASRAAALLGGGIYAASGFVSLWLNWPQGQVAALIPALFLATEKFISTPSGRRGLVLSAVVAWMAVEGFPAVLGYAGMAAAAFALVRGAAVATRAVDRARVFSTWVLFSMLGLASVAVHLAPFVFALKQFDLSYRDQSVDAHLPFGGLITTAFPWAYGAEALNDFYGLGNTVELVSFVGASALLLAGVACCARPAVFSKPVLRTFILLVTLCIILGWIGGPLLALFQQFPLFGQSAIGRLRSLLCFILAMMAAVGYDALRGWDSRGSLLRRAIPAVALCGLGLAIFAAYTTSVPAGESLASALQHVSIYIGSGLVGLTLILSVPFLARRGRAPRAALLLIPLLVATESLAFLSVAWPRAAPQTPYFETETTNFLASELGSDRFASPNGVMFPSANAAYSLRSATGHAFQATSWRDVLAAASPDAPRPPTLSMLSRGRTTATSPVLDRMGARYWVADPAYGVFGQRVSRPRAQGPAVRVEEGVSATVAVASGSKRAVVVEALSALRPRAGEQVRLQVQAYNANGEVVGDGVRSSTVPMPAGPIWIPIAADDGPAASATRLELSITGSDAEFKGDPAGRVMGDAVIGFGDGLALRLARDALVYERLHALPRVRWASRVVVEDDAAARLEMLSSLPPDATLLHAGTPSVQAASADVQVIEDSGDRMLIRVAASGDGYLVVADALQFGWTAFVDGLPAELLPAEHAFVAVPVPRGSSHIVELRYVPAGVGPGAGVSAAALLVGLSIFFYPSLRRRRAGVLDAQKNRPVASKRHDEPPSSRSVRATSL